MKKNFLLFFVSVLISCSMLKAQPQNCFGVLVHDGTTEHQISVAKQLGVHYVRFGRCFDNWQDDSKYKQISNAGFTVLFNVEYLEQKNEPRAYATDIPAYKATLSQMLSKYMPELVVIENEEENKQYYNGTPEQYVAELTAAVEVAHSKGLKVTNGGLIMPYLRLLVWQDYMNRGKQNQAEDFARRTFIGVPNPAIAMRNNPKYIEQMRIANTLIEAYKNLPLDYVNFHWYEPISEKRKGMGAPSQELAVDVRDMEEVVNYLERATGKPVITNEVGSLNQSADWVSGMLQSLYNLKLKYICWYSTDGGDGKAVALQNADGGLRTNGQAFASFAKQHQ